MSTQIRNLNDIRADDQKLSLNIVNDLELTWAFR